MSIVEDVHRVREVLIYLRKDAELSCDGRQEIVGEESNSDGVF